MEAKSARRPKKTGDFAVFVLFALFASLRLPIQEVDSAEVS